MVLGGKKSFQYKCKIEDTYITIDNKLIFEAIENLRKKYQTSYGPYKE